MSKADKLLDQMRHNPAGDWTIKDIQKLCKMLGWSCLPPMGGGSHWKVSVPAHETILTVPAKRPIKPIYIRKLMEMVKANENGQDD
jgi:predicted RNA binding protein YcfA (HicA-like mRNA interferase family)